MAIIAILSALYSACVYLVINWHHTKQSKQAEEHDSAITRLGNTSLLLESHKEVKSFVKSPLYNFYSLTIHVFFVNSKLNIVLKLDYEVQDPN